MQRSHHSHAVLRLAIAASLGLFVSLPLAAQDASQQPAGSSHRADKSATSSQAGADAAKAADGRFLAKATKGNEKEVAAATVAQQKASSADVREYAMHLLRDHQDMLVKLDQTSVALGISSTPRYVAGNGWGSDTGATAAGGTHTGGSVSGLGNSSATTTAGGMATAPTSGGMASTDHGGAMAGSGQSVPESASQDPAVRKLAGLSGAAFDRAFADQMVADHKRTIAEFERASKDQSLSAQTRELAANALPKLQGHLAMAETLRVNLKTSAK